MEASVYFLPSFSLTVLLYPQVASVLIRLGAGLRAIHPKARSLKHLLDELQGYSFNRE